jgi:osmotically-inducible protein OsmY
MRLTSTQRYVLFSLLCGACSQLAVAADTNGNVDNTSINTRDKNNQTLTPQDQSNRQADVRMAASVRKALTADSSLSTNAHNVKVMAEDGVVTLRGPVDSGAEMAKVEALAASVAGVTQVRSQLDVKH